MYLQSWFFNISCYIGGKKPLCFILVQTKTSQKARTWTIFLSVCPTPGGNGSIAAGSTGIAISLYSRPKRWKSMQNILIQVGEINFEN